jgi:hypothetical protein
LKCDAKQLDVGGDPEEADENIRLDVDLDLIELAESLIATTGSWNHYKALKLISQVANVSTRDEDALNASVAMMWEIKPEDAIEGMLAAQMTAIHNMSMEMASRRSKCSMST